MGVRNIRKQLAGEEDLLLGEGIEQQERHSGIKSITKLRVTKVVATIDDMLALDTAKFLTCNVTDSNRGGIFHFDINRVAENDGGTVLAGWVRQYDGPVNVKWFGSVLLEATYKRASDVKQSVLVEPGSYTLDANTIDFTGVKFHSFGVVTISTNTTLSVTNLVP